MSKAANAFHIVAKRAALAAFLFGAMHAPLASATDWNGSGGDNNWSTAGNWVGGVAPASSTASVVTFGAAGTTFTPFADSPWQLNRLDVTGATAYALSGGQLTFGGTSPQLNVSGAAHTITNDLSFLVTTTFTNSVDLTMTGPVAGVSGMIKAGSGRLTLANGLTYGGATTISAGTLQVGNGASGPTGFSLPIVNNAAIEFAGSGGLVNLAGISGTGTVTVTGGSVAGSSGDLTHTGTTTVSGGTLASFINNNARLTITGTGVVQTGDSIVGSLAGNGSIFSNSTAITLGGDNTNSTFNGTIAGAGGITKVGTGRFIMANTLTYSGQTTVSGGTLQVGDGVTGPSTFLLPIVNNAAIEFAGGAPSLALAGISGTGTVTVTAGTVAGMTGDLTHTGTTTVSGGSLASFINNNARLTISGTGVVQTGDSIVGSLAGNGTLFSNSTAVTVGGDNTNSTFNGTIAGAGGITKVGTGRFIMANALTYSGQTTVSGGILQVGDGVTGPSIFLLPIINNAAVEFAGGAPSVALAGISGTGTVTVTSGTVAGMTGDLTHTGTTTVSGGTLASFINNNARLTISGTGIVQTGDSIVGSLAGDGTLFSNSTAVTVGGDNTSTTFSGVIASVGGLTKVGTGAFTLSGVNTFTGTKTVNGGAILVTGSMPGPVIVNAGGTLGGTGTINGPVTVNAGGTLAPGLSPGIINTGNLNLAGIFQVEIQGTTLGTQYDNTNVTGTVTIAGATLNLAGAYVPAVGNTFTIISNDGADPVTGTFSGFPEGALASFNGVSLRVSYVGGTGNDVVLTAIAAAPPVANAVVPTQPEWVLAVLAFLLAATGMFAARRGRAR